MIKLRGTWTKIPADETHWQCEYGTDSWDLSCGTCTISPDKSNRGRPAKQEAQNRAHWKNIHDSNYLCSVHYEMLTYTPPPAPPLELPSADEFASTFDTK